MTLKLDMSKAYDKVKWVCLEKIMTKLGFAEKWKNLKIRYDPLSPYLFLLCAKALSALIEKVVDNERDGGFKYLQKWTQNLTPFLCK